MADITSINAAYDHAITGSSGMNARQAAETFLSAKVGDVFLDVNSPKQTLEALGLKAKEVKNAVKQAKAQEQLMGGVAQAAAWSHWASNVNDADFIAANAAQRGKPVPKNLDSADLPKWIDQQKAEWKNEMLDKLTSKHEDKTDHALTEGTSIGSMTRKALTFGGFAAAFLASFNGKDGKFSLFGGAKWLGLGNILAGLGGMIGGYLTGNVLGWGINKAGKLGGGLLDKVVGDKNMEKAKDFITGQKQNRENLRSVFENAMDSAVDAKAIDTSKVKNVAKSEADKTTAATAPAAVTTNPSTPLATTPTTGAATPATLPPPAATTSAATVEPNIKPLAADPKTTTIADEDLAHKSVIADMKTETERLTFQVKALECFAKNYGPTGADLAAVNDAIAALRALPGGDKIPNPINPPMETKDFAVISMADINQMVGDNKPLEEAIMRQATDAGKRRLEKHRDQMKTQLAQKNAAAAQTGIAPEDTMKTGSLNGKGILSDLKLEDLVVMAGRLPGQIRDDIAAALDAKLEETQDKIYATLRNGSDADLTKLTDQYQEAYTALEKVKDMQGKGIVEVPKTPVPANDQTIEIQVLPDMSTTSKEITK